MSVENAECLSYNPEYGEWVVNDGSGNVMINDMIFTYVPTIGNFYNIIGVVDYSYGDFKIEPRNGSDISDSSFAVDEVVDNIISLSNYPNPFNPSTTIFFELNIENIEDIKIEIYNLKGQIIDQLRITNYEFGINEVSWNAEGFASGMYYYKLTVNGEEIETKKMLILK